MAISSRDVENALRTIFRRCNQCPTDTAPSCPPSCPAGTVCIQTPPSCTVCASTTCQAIPDAGASTQPAKKSGPNVGAIAGGVVGGVVFVAIMTFIVWKFCLKGRRRPYEEGDYGEVALPQQEKPENDFASRRSARASTHTVASMASSVLTRASNIIQIAYIPGVTNRSGPGSPDVLVPPVPPIPIATSPSSGLSSPYSTSEQHFFVPDLRDSTYSASTDPRSSYARTSIAPSLARSSVATTIYRNNAIVSPLPAQTIVRGKAAVVSVKSSGSSSPSEAGMDTPPVPQIDPKHSGDSKSAQSVRIQMPRMFSTSSLSPQNSVRSTATLGPVRALNITKKKKDAGEKVESSSKGSTPVTTPSEEAAMPVMRPLTEVSVASTDGSVSHARARQVGSSADSDSDSDDDDHSRARRSLLRSSDVTDISQTPVESPFSDSSHAVDPADIPRRHGSTLSAPRVPLSPVKEESSKRASRASKRTQSPFSDDNATE